MLGVLILLPVGLCASVSDLARRLARLESRMADLERVAPKEFRVVHYNVLAEQYGSNFNPWFLYGANVTPEERDELLQRFYASNGKSAKSRGWPEWADRILSPERIAAVERYEQEAFDWDQRRERLWQTVDGCEADVLTLAECDHYDDFWCERLQAAGFESCWRKRPRDSSRDGCAIAWRSSTFELEATGGFDFGATYRSSAADLDRTCSFALLRWRREPNARVLIATTHLARNPESEKQLWPRSFQFSSIVRQLLGFATEHNALDVPVVLTGDLNAKDCDVLSGIARSMTLLLSTPAHPLLWSVLDAPTRATSVTDARACRIDYLLFQSAALRLLRVDQLPKLDQSIPDQQGIHPSDHLPVGASFGLKFGFDQLVDDARQWAACVAGSSVARPLSVEALRAAYSYFDKDGSGCVSMLELELGLQALGPQLVGGLDSRLRKILGLAPAGKRRSEEGEADEGTMSLERFVRLYSKGAARLTASGMARQLAMAFEAFDTDGDGSVTPEELREGLQAAATAPLDEARVAVLTRELDEDRDGLISRDEFVSWMINAYCQGLDEDVEGCDVEDDEDDERAI